MGDQLKVLSETTPSLLQGSLEVSRREGNREVGANPTLPVHSEGRGIVAHRGRVQGPPAAGQFTRLDGVVADRGEPITAWLPGQQNAASLHVFLLHYGLARGLRAVWEAGRTQERRLSLSGVVVEWLSLLQGRKKVSLTGHRHFLSISLPHL